jgi:hypothetical protein
MLEEEGQGFHMQGQSFVKNMVNEKKYLFGAL